MARKTADGELSKPARVKDAETKAIEPRAESNSDGAPPEDVEIVFRADALVGELGDFMISRIKAAAHTRPWDQLEEAEQAREIEHALWWARKIVAGSIRAVMERGLPAVPVTIEGRGWKGADMTIKCTGVFSGENAEHLSRHTGAAMLVLASVAQFESAMSEEAAPNQPALALGESEEIDPATGEIIAKSDAPVFDATAAGAAR